MKSIFALSHFASTAMFSVDLRTRIPLRNHSLMILYRKGINLKIAIALVNSVISFDKINDKRKIDKFSNYILNMQKET